MKDVQFTDLLGQTLSSIENIDDEDIVFMTQGGHKYKLTHFQDCCEDVFVEDICGDLSDLVDVPILLAEEVSNSDDPPLEGSDWYYTWTFYKLSTIKGSVTIRWFGSSNGYYSEAVDFIEVDN